MDKLYKNLENLYTKYFGEDKTYKDVFIYYILY